MFLNNNQFINGNINQLDFNNKLQSINMDIKSNIGDDIINQLKEYSSLLNS